MNSYTQLVRFSGLWVYFNAIGLTCLLSFEIYADIVTDGTVGPAESLIGPAFVIPESLGSRAGTNLFHSFSRFGIANGEQATFTGSPTIANVISRVTGGQVSNINGLLRSTVGQAGFYFLNPAGVTFGANAQIDVPGSFYISTADELRFPDGAVFSAATPSANELNIDKPESFGFLNDQTANVSFDQSNIILTPGNTLSINAGGIIIDGAQLKVERGDVQLISFGDVGGVVTLGGELSDAADGSLEISNSSIDVAGDGAGRLLIHAGNSAIIGSGLLADSLGPSNPTPGQGIDIQTKSLHVAGSLIASDVLAQGQQGANVKIKTTDELTIVDGGLISSSVFTANNITGRAGDINVNAGAVLIDSRGSNFLTGIVSQASNNFVGGAGNINLNVNNSISLLNGGVISNSSFGIGDIGNVFIQAESMTIDGQQSPFSTGVFNDVVSLSPSESRSINVNVDNALTIFDGGSIRSRTGGAADAGNINIDTGSLTIDSRGSNILTAIQSGTNAGSTGNSGEVNVNVRRTLSIIGDGSINTNTLGSGDSNVVNISADQATLDGSGGQIQATIGSNAFPGSRGNAGTVNIKVPGQLSLVSGSQISSTAFAEGNGGDIFVDTGSLLIDGQGRTTDTGITSGSQPGSTGHAGRVLVNVDSKLTIANEGLISSNTFGAGHAGIVNVNADQIFIQGNGGTRQTGITSAALNSSSGQTNDVVLNARTLNLFNAGVISIESLPTLESNNLASIVPTSIAITTDNITLKNSDITSKSFGNIPAGSIILNVADTLSLNPSSISTAANNADGGAISIQAKVIDLQDSQITTSVGGQGDGGDINLDTGLLVMDSGFIQANTGGINAQGGDIRIDTDVLLAEGNNLRTGGNTPLTFRQGVNVIQAAAPDGISGTIDITTPQLDISGELIDLDSELVDVDELAQSPCTVTPTKQSTFVNLGPGGLPESPSQSGSIRITPKRLQQLITTQSYDRDIHAGATQAPGNLYTKASMKPNPWRAWSDSNCEY